MPKHKPKKSADRHRHKTVSFRLPEDLINQIDEDLGQRDVPLSRNNWLLEAAIEKLRKGGSGGSHGAK